jgi:phosphate transport system protein
MSRDPATVRKSFHEELGTLEAALQEQSQLVLRSVRGAIKALEDHDVELADDVIAFDDEVDAHWLEIEHGVESLLARQTPVAVDLRLVLAVLHINLHLERAADLCTTVAKLMKLAGQIAGQAQVLGSFSEMGERAEEMITVAMRAFSERDLAAAESLVVLDELLDRANRRLVRHVLALGTDEAAREWGLRMIVISRCLERIGDHFVDIGEQTAYLITGEIREFSDASHGVDDGEGVGDGEGAADQP